MSFGKGWILPQRTAPAEDALHDWIDKLQEAGVIPLATRRIVIDIDINAIAKVYYECNADERMFDDDLLANLQRAEKIGVKDLVVSREKP